jgi:hypothetical protein
MPEISRTPGTVPGASSGLSYRKNKKHFPGIGMYNERIRYVYDAAGQKQNVIIPIELWEKTHQVKKPRHAPCNPRDYYRIDREKMENFGAVGEALRSEGNRV